MNIVRKARVIALILAVMLLAVPLMAGCARPAPAQTTSPTPAPVPKATLAPTSAPAPKADPVADIIAGAKKEGVVSTFLHSALNVAEVNLALEKAIKDKYGVDLKIQTGGGRGMGQQMAASIMEYKTGVTPTFDLMGFTTAYIPEGIKAGIFEIVDWKTLVEPGTLPDAIPQQPSVRGSIVYISSAIGLQYNPNKISAAEVPKKITDLLDPKWKGRLGMFSYTSYWTDWTYILGKDYVLSTLRSIVQTKPIIAEFVGVNNRYLLGEIDLAFMNAAYIISNQKKNMPTAFRSLDIVQLLDTHLLVPKGAPHLNAARLLAVFLTSPDGVKFLVDKANVGVAYVPGNYMYDIYQNGLKEGLKVSRVYDYPGLLDFAASPQYEALQKEIELIIKQ